MKFGEAFTEYLQAHQERFLEDCSHVEYKRLKKVLKSCRTCRDLKDSSEVNNGEGDALSPHCQCESCPVCDQRFFSELTKEASDIAGCFGIRVRHLLNLHEHKIQRFITFVRQCFRSPQQATEQECRMLIEYVIMNALAIRKILKKYDKVHSSANGRKFKSKMLSEHIEVLQSPWLIELGAFYINFSKSNGGRFDESLNPFSCDLCTTEPKMTLMLPDMVKLEYNLTCPICLELVFKPYALGCGHLFCKSCACAAASVMIFEGPKAACSGSKCPVCREVKYHNVIPIYRSLDIFMILHSKRNPLVLWTRFCFYSYQKFFLTILFEICEPWLKSCRCKLVIQLLKEKNCTASAQLRIASYVGRHSFSI